MKKHYPTLVLKSLYFIPEKLVIAFGLLMWFIPIVMAQEDPISLKVPVHFTGTTCMTQEDVDAAYTEFVNGASYQGGCNGNLTIDSPLDAPPFCGGSVVVTWTVTSNCDGEEDLFVQEARTFTIPDAPLVDLTLPADYTGTECMTQDAVNTAFDDWLADAASTGGC
ncbi:MAG: hypothetical protein K0B37_17040, partial [Bacteroidales bacterium]|nr:hypothetical protein [Bacteroidales bacterium]